MTDKNKRTRIQVAVFSHPSSNPNKDKVIEYLKELPKFLVQEFESVSEIAVIDGTQIYPKYGEFLSDFLEHCRREFKGFDLQWAGYISRVARIPEEHATMEEIIKHQYPEILRYFEEIHSSMEIRTELGKGPKLGAQFLIAEGLPLIHPFAIEGASLWDYPESLSIVNVCRQELVFHEFLHQLGLADGYDEKTLAPKRGCENCWMQYLPWEGNGLCSIHRTELKLYLARIASRSTNKRVLDLRGNP